MGCACVFIRPTEIKAVEEGQHQSRVCARAFPAGSPMPRMHSGARTRSTARVLYLCYVAVALHLAFDVCLLCCPAALLPAPCQSSAASSPIMEFDLSVLLTELELTMEQFIDLCILCGCDYASNIRGIGAVRALSLIKQHGSIEAVIKVCSCVFSSSLLHNNQTAASLPNHHQHQIWTPAGFQLAFCSVGKGLSCHLC